MLHKHVQPTTQISCTCVRRYCVYHRCDIWLASSPLKLEIAPGLLHKTKTTGPRNQSAIRYPIVNASHYSYYNFCSHHPHYRTLVLRMCPQNICSPVLPISLKSLQTAYPHVKFCSYTFQSSHPAIPSLRVHPTAVRATFRAHPCRHISPLGL